MPVTASFAIAVVKLPPEVHQGPGWCPVGPFNLCVGSMSSTSLDVHEEASAWNAPKQAAAPRCDNLWNAVPFICSIHCIIYNANLKLPIQNKMGMCALLQLQKYVLTAKAYCSGVPFHP